LPGFAGAACSNPVSIHEWPSGGEPAGSINIVAQPNGVRLLDSLTVRDGTKTIIEELVPFACTATMFDGRRQWFMCLTCRRRCPGFLGAAISDDGNAMALCTTLRASRHTNAPSIGLIAFGSVVPRRKR